MSKSALALARNVKAREAATIDKEEVNITPQGWTILVQPYKMDEMTEAGIIIPDQTRQDYDLAEMISKVIELGPDAYHDKVKFPNGPRCKVNDFVICSPYQGIVIKFKDFNMKIINDDQVLAIIDDPEKLKRI